MGGIPWAPPYMRPPEEDRIAQLLMHRGRAQAQGTAAQGQILGGALAGLGQIAAGAVEQRQASKRDAAVTQAIQSWDGQDEMGLAKTLMGIMGPDGLKAAQMVVAFRKPGPTLEDDLKSMGLVLKLQEGQPDEEVAQGYPAFMQRFGPTLQKIGGTLPEQFNPEVRARLEGLGKTIRGEKSEAYTLGPNEKRMEGGKEIASNPVAPKPEKGPGVGSFEDYVLRKFGPQPTPEQIEQARKAYQQADDRPIRPIVPVVIQTEQGPQLLDRSTGTTRAIKDAGGEAVRPAPTADMRNKAAARSMVAKSIMAIENLSKRILTRVGPGQRAEAIKRGAEAVFGKDPEFRTYQDSRMALAGNLAVAQQGSRPSDADIKAIWLPMVPDAYRDTAESAAMKWQLIKTMQGQEGAPETPSGEGWIDLGGGVRVREKK